MLDRTTQSRHYPKFNPGSSYEGDAVTYDLPFPDCWHVWSRFVAWLAAGLGETIGAAGASLAKQANAAGWFAEPVHDDGSGDRVKGCQRVDQMGEVKHDSLPRLAL